MAVPLQVPPSPHQRRVEIASILAKYGWDILLFKLSLIDFLPSRFRQKLAFSSFLARKELETDPDSEIVLPLPAVFRTILEELGPTYVKLGQILSTRADLIPPAYIEELAKLQEQVTPCSWEEMEPVLLEEWNCHHGTEVKHAEEIFLTFDQVPLASGSLAQAYKVTFFLEGAERKAIVKIQRPGIGQIVQADIAVMLEFARLLTARTNWGRWNNLLGLAEEFSTVIRNELDFRLEAANTEEIGGSIRRHYGASLTAPRVFWEFTTGKILALEFMNGAKLSSLFNGGIPLEQGKQIAQTLTDCFLRQIFADGFFHADPHPGNILYQASERRSTMAVIDYGMVGRLDPRSRELLTEFLLATLNFDAGKATDRILEYGYPTESLDRRALTMEFDHLLREALGKPVHEILMGRVLQRVLDLMLKYRVRMPSSFLMLVRVMVTVEGICRQLDPDYMLIQNAKPFILGHLKRQFTDSVSSFELLKMAVDWKTILRRLPRKLDDLLTQATAGQLRIEYE
ncbi:MAG TPA: AarF/UbiB family protein, partial [Chroococcales cyanobacterium]